jgi:transcriptional regulator with XRE-family HTH domain
MTAYEYLKRHGKARADQVADAAEISPAYFNQICHGHRYPSRAVAERLVKVSKRRLKMSDLLYPHPSRIDPKRLKA